MATQISILGGKWHCHCCSAANEQDVKKCRVCGRPDSYALDGYPLPLHGAGAKLFRPSQVNSILTEEGLFERDSVQWTALHSAAVNGNTPMVVELLSRGALIDARTDQGQTALHLAVHSGSLDTVQTLLEHGSDVNVVTMGEKLTPLHIACQRDWKVIAKVLLDHGADVNAQNIIERTPLHFAAETGRTDLAVLLLKSHAKPAALDLHGWTPRQVAELHGHRQFQELLVQSAMTEKQIVMKNLPVAPWHGDLWNGVVRFHKVEKEKAGREIEQAKVLVRESELFRQKIRDSIALKNRQERASSMDSSAASSAASLAAENDVDNAMDWRESFASSNAAASAAVTFNAKIGTSKGHVSGVSGVSGVSEGGGSGGGLTRSSSSTRKSILSASAERNISRI